MSGTALARDTGTTTAIINALVFDGTGKAAYPATVLIRDQRIVDVGTRLRVPKGAISVDADGKTLMPGLFDLHTHWTPNSSPSSSAVLSGVYLAAGVTTVNDFHQAPESYAPRREWLGSMVAPHVNFAARMSTPLGHGADWADTATTRWVNSPDAARDAVRELAPYKPDMIKVFTDGWRYGHMPDNTSMDPWTLTALVEEAHANGLKVATHTVTAERAGWAGDAKVDLIAHSIQDRVVDAETIARLKAGGTFYAPTLAVYEPVKMGSSQPADPESPAFLSRQRNFRNAMENVRVLHKAGVPIALGTDAGMPGTPHGAATLRELELLVQAGLSPAEALQAGTATSAAAIGLQDDRGRIAKGQRADLLLVDGRPWENIQDINKLSRVWLDGQLVLGPGAQLPASNSRPYPRPEVVGPLVDDFERADERTALDTLRTDDNDGGNDRTWQLTRVVVRGEGGHALRTMARMSSKDRAYAAVVLPLSRGSVKPVDLRGYRGVRFDIRGEDGRHALMVKGLEGGRWKTAINVQPQWQQVSVDFSQLEYAPYRAVEGETLPWRGDDATDLQFIVDGEGAAMPWFELDNVEFY
ncbi:amidohydrolase family protein [Lysobacter sp. A03]|uniref:amidohydrolase family protein n=1 Tax=Lysobacter sp. A03 TaxID=1199154 RepID=UPI0005B719D4|nr:amidohydrolase family protein [Lysobacter sp. A03]KIQ97007.1 amidohydrolase [Lysobacter sp. A03]